MVNQHQGALSGGIQLIRRSTFFRLIVLISVQIEEVASTEQWRSSGVSERTLIDRDRIKARAYDDSTVLHSNNIESGYASY